MSRGEAGIHAATRQRSAARPLLFDAGMEAFFFVVATVFLLGVCGIAVLGALVSHARAIAALRDRAASLEVAVFELRVILGKRVDAPPHPFRTPAPMVRSLAPVSVSQPVPAPVPDSDSQSDSGSIPSPAPPMPMPMPMPMPATATTIAEAPARPTELRLSDAAEQIAQAAGGFGTWERFLGVRAAAALGAIVLVVAGVFFVRFSIAEGVLTPAIRVLLGALLGVATWVASETVLRKRYPVLASWLGGAAVAILYLVVWAAAELYGLVPGWVGFAGMAAITACATALAIVRRSAPIAMLGCLGGFATPLVLGTSSTPALVLFLYLLVLDVAFLAIARYRESAVVALVSAAATAVYVGARLLGGDFDLVLDTVIAAAFGALFAFAPIGSSVAAKCARWIGLSLPIGFALGLVVLGASAHLLPIAILGLVTLAGARFSREEPWLAALVATGVLGTGALFALTREIDATNAITLVVFVAAVVALAPSRHRGLVVLAVPWALLPAACRLASNGDAFVLVPALAVAIGAGFVAVRAVHQHTHGAIVRANAISAALFLTTATIVARESSPSLGLALAVVALVTALAFVGVAYARDRVFGSAAILFAAIAFAGTVIASSTGALEIGLGLVYALLVAAGGAMLDKTHYRALAMLLVTCGAARWLADLDGGAALGLQILVGAAVVLVAATAASSYAFGRRTRASAALGAVVFPIAVAPLALAFPAAPIVAGALALELGLFALAILRRDEHSKLAAHLAFGVSLALAAVLAHVLLSGAALTVALAAIGTGIFLLARHTSHAALVSLGFAFFGWTIVRIAERALGGELATLAVETSCVAAGAAIATLATDRRLTRALLLTSTIGALGAALYLAVGAFFEPSAPVSELVLSRLPARDVTHSLVFAAFGGALLALGLWQKSTPLRVASLAVVLSTLAKVFLFDVGRLDDLARVASLTALAVSLIAISFVYQRFVFRRVQER